MYHIVSIYSGYHLRVERHFNKGEVALIQWQFRPDPAPHATREAAEALLAEHNDKAGCVRCIVLDDEQLKHFVCELDQPAPPQVH